MTRPANDNARDADATARTLPLSNPRVATPSRLQGAFATAHAALSPRELILLLTCAAPRRVAPDTARGFGRRGGSFPIDAPARLRVA